MGVIIAFTFSVLFVNIIIKRKSRPLRQGSRADMYPAHETKDLRFCKNEGLKRSNNNEKGGQQDLKSSRILVQIASKVK